MLKRTIENYWPVWVPLNLSTAMPMLRIFLYRVLPLIGALVGGGPVSVCAEEFAAFTAPFREIDLAAPEPGIIEEIKVEVGQSVTAGQIVAKMDARVLQAVLKVAETRAAANGRVVSARASRDLRRHRLEKLAKLAQSGNARPDELTIARAELAIAKGELQARLQEQQIEKLEAQKIQAQISRRSLRSPVDGLVTKINKDVAERVGLNTSEPVMTIAQLHPLRVEIFVNETTLRNLRTDADLTVILSASGEATTAKVDYIVPTIDAESGTTSVMLLLDNEDHQIRSGARCTVAVPAIDGHDENIASIPSDEPSNGELK